MESSLDFALAELVWSDVSSHTDEGLLCQVQAVNGSYSRLKELWANWNKSLTHDLNRRVLLSIEVTRFSANSAMFYGALKKMRRLSFEEKEAGKNLARLHKQGMKLIHDEEKVSSIRRKINGKIEGAKTKLSGTGNSAL